MSASRRERNAVRAIVAPLVALLALSGTGPASPVAASSQIRGFTPRFQTTDRGSIALIGNTLMTCPDSNGACGAARNGTGGTINNNDFSMVYVDMDADPSTFDSSSADLSLPAGADVLFAGLYWGAQSASASRDQVRFAVPGGGYQAVTADTVDVTGNNYAAVADVTSVVAALTSPNGTYMVANVEGTLATNQEAGWSLIVAYRDLVTPAPLRNLTVFDGYVVVNSTAPSTITTSVSGFLTPASGTVNAEMGMVTFEGDLGLTGDQFRLNGTNISNAANPLSNTFNSSISRLGTTVTTKDPNYVNQLGFDVDLLDGTGLIANSATSANLTFTSSGDTYYPTALTFAVDVFQPRLIATKAQSDVNGGVLAAGDEIEYTVDVTNLGNDAAINTVLTDPIPAGTTYVPGSASVVSGANAGAFTDAAGDDVGEFDSANNRVVVRLGTGATSAAGGQLDPGAATEIRFRVSVNAGLPAGTRIQNQAHLTYSGLTLGGSFTGDSDADGGQPGDQPTDLGLNSPPVATADSASTPEDTAVTVDVLANDTDVDGNIDPSTVALTSGPSHGSTTVDPATGRVTYTPDADWHGSDTFNYQVCDTAAACATALVSIGVTSVNDPPTAAADSTATVVDTPVSVDVLANDADVDGALDPSTVTVASGPSHGSTTVDPVTGAITYTPDPGWTGSDAFTYQVCDDAGACDTATVSVSVGVSNAPPAAVDDGASTTEDTAVTIDVLANDADADGNLDPSTVTITGDPAHGVTSVDPATGAVTYTPDPDWNGSDSFTYQVCDALAVCDTASVAVDVAAVNDPPTAVNDGASTPEDTAVIIDVPANDTDVDGNLDPTTVSITAGPSNGTVSVDPATGEVTYTPSSGYSGADSFDYQVCDTDGACDSAVASVAVNWVNHLPVAADDSASTVTDVDVTIDVVANDSDPDGNLDPSTVTIQAGATNGTVSVDPSTFLVTYAPATGYTGPDAFTYQVCDTAGACATATVTVTVSPANAPPVATNDTAAVQRNGAVTVNVLANDWDPDGNLDPTTLAVARGPGHGTLVFDSTTGPFTYTPASGWSGIDTFDYLVCDTAGLCDTATVSVTVYVPSPLESPSPSPSASPSVSPSPAPSPSPVASPWPTPVDAPPVARDDTGTTPKDTTIAIDVLANDSDPDGSLVPSSVVVTNPPAHGRALVDPATGRVTYRPNAGFTGIDAFTYRVCDAAGACDSAVMTVTVASLPVTATGAPPRGGTGGTPAGLVLAIIAAAGLYASAAFDRRRGRRRLRGTPVTRP